MQSNINSGTGDPKQIGFLPNKLLDDHEATAGGAFFKSSLLIILFFTELNISVITNKWC